MKRPIIGTIVSLALLGGGLYIGWQYYDKPAGAGVQNLGGAAARSAMISTFDMVLPASAIDVSYCEEAIDKTRLVFASFDAPGVELPAILDARGAYPQFPAAHELKDDTNLLQAMIRLSDPVRRPWWKPAELRQAQCAQTLGRRGTGPAQFKWRLLVCAAPRTEQVSRVYLAFSEEPAVSEEK